MFRYVFKSRIQLRSLKASYNNYSFPQITVNNYFVFMWLSVEKYWHRTNYQIIIKISTVVNIRSNARMVSSAYIKTVCVLVGRIVKINLMNHQKSVMVRIQLIYVSKFELSTTLRYTHSAYYSLKYKSIQ